MQGNLTDMSVPDLIQHICVNGKNAQIKIHHGDRLANIYVEKGNVVHAAMDDQEGDVVVYDIMDWDTGTFDLEKFAQPPKTTITKKWQALLLECARKRDEKESGYQHSENNQSLKQKEHIMNTKALNTIIEELQEDLGAGLVATDIWLTADGQSLAGFNPQPKATALFNEVTRTLEKKLKDSEFPALGNYYMLNLENNLMVVVVKKDVIQQGMLIDLSKAMLGIVINVSLPKVLKGLEEAIS